MEAQFTTLGALIGLAIAIVLIIKKVQPAYSLILGALIGGLIGGGGLSTTVSTMVSGAGSMMSSILRILTSGILAGSLIKTGSAEKIAETIVEKLGEKRAVAAISSYNDHLRRRCLYRHLRDHRGTHRAGDRKRQSSPRRILIGRSAAAVGNIISPNLYDRHF